jgi:flagellar biosynthesis protein FlhA
VAVAVGQGGIDRRGGGLIGQVLKHADLGVAICVVLVVVMMVLPLPAVLLDVLITINLAIALTVVLLAMYTQDALDLSVFPSLLLFTTLFRLAINISVTRLILLHGDAGSVIHAFGSFVVGGNVVVGLVVFLIIVVVQFVVITNGAGRVAEVAARFTLDAMPGKQMAIDADLNAGQITDDEARTRRDKIQREADFYGAMDGASKFVKGDAIAGIVIVAINLLAGIAIGVAQQGRSFSDALTTFSLLSIGDGLAAQIPALLISTATGIIVTRAATDTASNLGSDMAAQMLRNPRPLFICATVLLALGLVPGLPKVPFILLAVIVGSLAFGLRQRHRDMAEDAVAFEEAEAQKALPAPPDAVTKSLSLDTLELEIGYGLIPLVDESEGGELLKRVGLVRKQMATELGLVLQPIRIRDNVQLASHAYAVRIKGSEVARGELAAGCLLAMNPGDADPSLTGEATVEPAFGLPALWVPEGAREQAEAGGYTVVDHASIVITHLTETVRQHAAELLSRQDARTLLDHLRERFPAVVDELVPDGCTVAEVHRVLQLLLAEGVSVRDLVTILETLGDRARLTKDSALLAEYCRQALARQLTQAAVDAFGTLAAVVLDPTLESELADSVIQTTDGSYLGLDPGRAEAIVRALRDTVEAAAENGHRASIVCSPKVRRHLRALAAHALPRTPVLSYNEILPSTHVDAVGTVELATEGSLA